MNIVFPDSTVFSLKGSIEYSQGGIISKQITKKTSGNITLFSFDEGQGLTEHTASFDAVIQILDGEAEIKIDGNPYLIKNGECIVMPANHPHSVYAVKRFKMLLTMIK